MRAHVRGRVLRRRLSLVVQLGALVVLAGVLAGCDTTPVVLSGRVSAAPSGIGAGGVSVAVYADDAETLVAETTSNLAGDYVLRASSVADGAYRVRVGDRWWPDGGSWADADTVALSASAATTIDVSFDEIGSLDGVVVDDEGVPLDAIVVAVLRVSDGQVAAVVETGAYGEFSVGLVSPGAHRVLFVDPAESWPWVFVGGATPTEFDVAGGTVTVEVGTIDISTGLPLAPPSGTTTRVSVGFGGVQGNGASSEASISADGRYVAFSSEATVLAGGVPGGTDVFVHDRSTGATERVSVTSAGATANGASFTPSISADGRYVAFMSSASTLVPGDTNGWGDVFVHDRSTGETERVSVTYEGAEANSESDEPSISADGRFVAFRSHATNLVPGGSNNASDVFVHDRSTGDTERVSVVSGGGQAVGGSDQPSISADGRYVAFRSDATNLAADDTNNSSDVFVRDRSAGTTERVSVSSDGAQAFTGSDEPSISGDGGAVAFRSRGSNLVVGDTNAIDDVFVRDRSAGTTERVSVASDGAEGDAASFEPSLSADGRHVAFTSWASTLAPGDTNALMDVYVHDRSTGATEWVSVGLGGAPGDEVSYGPSITGDGGVVAFSSWASNLVVDDTNGDYDVFVRQRPPG